MASAQPPRRSGITIQNAEQAYSQSTFGPSTDTNAHNQTPPPHARSSAPAETRSSAPSKRTPIPDFRRVARKGEPAPEPRRPIRIPSWLVPVGAVLVFLAFMAGGVVVVVGTIAAERATRPAPPEPAPVEDLDGVPVRKGLGQR